MSIKHAIAVVLLTFAGGASAIEPLNWQGNQEYFWRVTAPENPNALNEWLTGAGYRYEWFTEPTVVCDHITSPIPEPPSWALMLAGALIALAMRRLCR